MRDVMDYTLIGFLVGLAYFFVPSTEAPPEPVEEIPSVIVRIVDGNKVIHSREGMLLDGEVTVYLGGK
jgi:hypothetical protein